MSPLFNDEKQDTPEYSVANYYDFDGTLTPHR